MLFPPLLNSQLTILSLFEDRSDSSDGLILPELPIATLKKPLEPYELRTLCLPRATSREVDVSICLWLPPQEFRSEPFRSVKYSIAWKIIRTENDKWRSKIYFSTLPSVRAPCNGIDLFQQLIVCLKDDWIRLCDLAEGHLLKRVSCGYITFPLPLFDLLIGIEIQRRDQLDAKGKIPELLDRLASDAQKWDDLRRGLRAQVFKANQFATNYCQQYTSAGVPKDVKGLIDAFDVEIGSRIGELDQTVRDLLQIVGITLFSEKKMIRAHRFQEFAWTSITETRISTRLGQNVMLLTYVSIFYLPLAFCAVSMSKTPVYQPRVLISLYRHSGLFQILPTAAREIPSSSHP